ncbi:MAG: glutamine--fructose-6-phosphate transaminase (isomerizing), partial [Abditibacteriales bacterium]|nr:glutamine--fructose-6-phosphate transaminase (isomerizing) [Abditibacteriales bacterium]MDW8365032.1 glutamine--fructose-6-phosphate transaminase (isomerizing) [Abditibacteriales bacterium]
TRTALAERAGLSLAAVKHLLENKRNARETYLTRAYPQAEGVRSLLQRYLDGDVVFQEVQSVRAVPAPSPFVYDLEVPGTENFIANGLLSHNSRWATHGEPSELNAHPHSDCTGRLHVVHNGIIENYHELREELERAGHRFASATDTESVAHLIEAHYRGNLADAVRRALRKVRGSFALVVLCQDEPDKLVVARRQSPLLLGLGQGENFVASDVPALLRYTRHVIFLDDDEMAVVTRDGVEVTDLEGRIHRKTAVHIDWDAAAAERGGYPHFMLKEIHEQPEVIRRVVARYTAQDRRQIRLDEMNLSEDELRSVRRICIQACGTSWHAGLVGRLLLERLPRIPVDTDISSEFRYRNAILEPNTLVVGISQSGETADTLAGIREARSRGLKVVSIVNVPGSSVARESDGVIYTHAGPEIGVASTKAYTAQIAALYLFALRLGQLRGTVDDARLQRRLKRLEDVAAHMETLLAQEKHIAAIAQEFYQARDFIFIGRGFGYPSALEGALKLKEISYIHAEGYPAGELKHGPIALIDEKMPVVAIATRSEEDTEISKTIYEKILSNIQEVKARKGKVIAIAAQGDETITQLADHVIYVPEVTYSFTPFVVALPLQLLAYHIAVLRGCDVDQPRNLAKSVTVE